MVKPRTIFLSLLVLGTFAATRAEAIILTSCENNCPYYPCYSRCIDDNTQQITTCSAYGAACTGFASMAQESPESAALDAIFSPVATAAD
jgi:hypothetical protein